MIYKYLKKEFNNSSDLKYEFVNNVSIIYLESITSSDKINEYILDNITLKKNYLSLRDLIGGPSVVILNNKEQASYYLLNGYAIVSNNKDIIACEVKGDLYRAITNPTTEVSVNGPKDSFNENIVSNIGLIKRRIKNTKLINEDFEVGNNTKTKISLLYIDDKVESKSLKILREIINKTLNLDIFDSESLAQQISSGNPFPTILKTERPDRVSTALLEGKIAIAVDNSPFMLILPAFFIDFINPQGDNYVKAININFLKIVRFLCFLITLFLPAIYIAIINYNQESIPLKLLLAFQAGRNGVPFPSSFEAIFMIFLCIILRESDIRFPSNYGSSISIVGALILGEAAVSANIVSPIMIIIIGITFITALVFNNGELIDALRFYRIIILLLAICLGLYGVVLGYFIILINLCKTKTLNIDYLYPIAPFNNNYFFNSFLKKKNNKVKK